MLTIVQAKAMFFDRDVATDVMRKKKQIGARWGAFVRRVARNSIRRRKAASAEGSAPSSHTDLLRNWILFGWDPETESTVVGPVKLNKGTDAPATLESGGLATIMITRHGLAQRKQVRIGARPYMAPAAAKGQAKLPGLIAEVGR